MTTPECTAPSKLHLVDAWHTKRFEPGLAIVRSIFAQEILQNTVEINRGLSTEVLASFPDGYFDWVYIDTNHTYETTASELAICRKKMKPGGRIAGHDFSVGNIAKPVVYGVIQATMDFCAKFDWCFEYLALDGRGYMSFCLREIE